MSAERRSGAERRRPITVVLIDEEPLMRAAVGQMLSRGGLHVIGLAPSGEGALAMVTDLRPDVVVMDLDLPQIGGIETIERIARVDPASRILILTRGSQNHVVEAIVAGASGYILKDAPPETIVAAVKATGAGESVLSPAVAGRLLARVRERDTSVTANDPSAANAIRAALTPRELEIFRRLASGESNQTIGRELSLSTNTISNHIASILAKLHLENRIQAAVQAVRSGIA